MIVTPFSALHSWLSLFKPGSGRTVDSMRLVLCSILASDKTQRLGQILREPAPGDVEVPGTTIHREISFVSDLRLEGRDRGVDAGDIGSFGGEIRLYLARHRPCQQRFDKTKTLIIRGFTVGAPQIEPCLREDRREPLATE